MSNFCIDLEKGLWRDGNGVVRDIQDISGVRSPNTLTCEYKPFWAMVSVRLVGQDNYVGIGCITEQEAWDVYLALERARTDVAIKRMTGHLEKPEPLSKNPDLEMLIARLRRATSEGKLVSVNEAWPVTREYTIGDPKSDLVRSPWHTITISILEEACVLGKPSDKT